MQPSITALAVVQYGGDKVLKCFPVNALQLQTDEDKPPLGRYCYHRKTLMEVVVFLVR